MDVFTKNKLGTEFEKLPMSKTFVYLVIFSLINIVIGIFSQIILPPEIPLFYGLPQNSEQLAPSILIILPSIVSALIIVLNILISIKSSDVYIKKTLVFASILVTLLSTVTTYKILFLVSLF